MSLRFVSGHPLTCFVGILGTAMPGKSVIFSKKHRISNGNEDDDAVRALTEVYESKRYLW